jgi:glyoxylase I family protein
MEQNIDFSSIEALTAYFEVFDMPASLRFYRDILGFTVHQSSGEGDDVGWVWLVLNGAHLMLNTAYDVGERPPVPDPARIGGHRDVTLYFGYPDIDAFYRYLLEKGVNVSEPTVTKYNFKAIGFRDPDGFYLCFHWPVG